MKSEESKQRQLEGNAASQEWLSLSTARIPISPRQYHLRFADVAPKSTSKGVFRIVEGG
jgi:hypothetical protein